MSTFNPDTFLNIEVSSPNATAYVPVAEGEFTGSIKKIAPRVLNDGRAVLDVTWAVDDETTRQETGMAEPTVRQTIWLDLNESGSLDFGKGRNVGLGRLRDALGQNETGKLWQPGMMVGGVAKIKVTHSIDKRDNETIQAGVVSVAKL